MRRVRGAVRRLSTRRIGPFAELPSAEAAAAGAVAGAVSAAHAAEVAARARSTRAFSRPAGRSCVPPRLRRGGVRKRIAHPVARLVAGRRPALAVPFPDGAGPDGAEIGSKSALAGEQLARCRSPLHVGRSFFSRGPNGAVGSRQFRLPTSAARKLGGVCGLGIAAFKEGALRGRSTQSVLRRSDSPLRASIASTSSRCHCPLLDDPRCRNCATPPVHPLDWPFL